MLEESIKIMQGDCLTLMKDIPAGSIDMILCDLPYGTTACKWDIKIPLESLWEQYSRIIKYTGVIALFGSEPFSSRLRMGNLKMYKYDWMWKKNTCTGFQHANNMPMKDYETISVFSRGGMGHKNLLGEKRMNYNPQGLVPCGKYRNGKKPFVGIVGARPSHKDIIKQEYTGYPKMVLEFNSEKGFHTAQKPVALLEYLIKTYTNEGETVLDNCMGSGSTGIACLNTNRKFIGMEIDSKYFGIAKERIEGYNKPQLVNRSE